MDGRDLKILICAGLYLATAAVGTVRAQEPLGPGQGKPFLAQRAGREQDEMRRLEQLPPDERETFKHNLALWHDLPPEERMALRDLARARAHAEVDKAIQESGLRLDQDQREMYGLRYAQERRKLERDLQRKAALERAQRMPEILAKLKSEFSNGAPGTPVNPAPAAKAPGTPAPDATPVPGFMR